MKFTSQKKKAIVMYILEKIARGEKGVTKAAAEACDISQNTANTYVKELLAAGVIRKIKNGTFELVTRRYERDFLRSKGELVVDTTPYDVFLAPLIAHLDNNILHIWSYAFSEMVNNVIDHSEAERMRVIVHQNYMTTTVYVLDDGVGVFQKIQNHFSLPSLEDAICELMKGKLTTDEKNHSGEGIFFSSKMMDSFVILSGNKVYAVSKDADDIFGELGGCSGTGTCVRMELSNFSNKTTIAIFNQYSNEDDHFVKTRVFLKNIFDAAPVSRSQAKRVCHRLDSFQEVLIDFEGIDWMGQGFAHQLFVVYQNQHPTIKLMPINMSDGVASMYRHVTNTQ